MWLTNEEVANLFRVDGHTVGRWRRDGKLDGVRMTKTLGGHHRYSYEDIYKLVNDSTREYPNPGAYAKQDG